MLSYGLIVQDQTRKQQQAKMGEPCTSTLKALTQIHKDMEEQLKRLADLMTANISLHTKEVLTSNEAAHYMGVSKSYLYKLTMNRQIPYYKPTGKMCYFNRAEIEDWLQSNRVSTSKELTRDAMNYCKKGGRL